MSFCETQLDRITPLRERMLSHPFLVQTRDGTIPHEKSSARQPGGAGGLHGRVVSGGQ